MTPSNPIAAPAGAAAPEPPFTWQHTLLLALGGPVLFGAILGLELGPAAALLKALALPAVLAGVAVVMVPALYIGATLTGVAPPARDIAAALGRSLRACGLVLLGLAGPVLFLLATTRAEAVTAVFGATATAAAVLVGLRVLCADLFEGRSPRAMVAFGAWALVALGIGLRLYTDFVAG